MPISVATAWTPDFQDLDLGHGRTYQGVTGTLAGYFYFWILGLLSLFSKQTRWLIKHCHQHCYWEFEDLSFFQTLGANSGNALSKVNYDSKPRESKGLMNFCPHTLLHMMNHLIERRNLESRLSQNSVHPMPPDCWVFSWTFWPPSLCCSTSLQIWYLDFCSWWFLLKKTPFQWTAVT